MDKEGVFASWLGTGTGLIVSQLNEIVGLIALLLTATYTAFRFARDIRKMRNNQDQEE